MAIKQKKAFLLYIYMPYAHVNDISANNDSHKKSLVYIQKSGICLLIKQFTVYLKACTH